uniref:Uncharacterized protein n=1 Tax=Panagrolaimus davidi TaxID=227884 RepID=A0A914QIP0_9BILA
MRHICILGAESAANVPHFRCRCPCSTCPALPLREAPNVPRIQNGLGAVTERVNSEGCKSYTVSCQATAGAPPVGIGGIQNGMIVVAAGPTPGPITVELVCNAEAKIQGTDVMGTVRTFNSVYCVQADVPPATPECATCTLPKLDAPETATSITTDGTVTVELGPDGCQIFTIRCVPTLPDGNNRPVCMGVNLQTIGLAFGNGPQQAMARCNNQGMVEALTLNGDIVIAESVYCCQNKMI